MAVRQVRRAVVLAVAAAVVAALPWNTRAANPSAADKKAKTVEVLVGQGNAALEVKSYASARDTFSDALTLDEHNVDATVGEALARMELGESTKAVEVVDKVTSTAAPTRYLAINSAVIHIRGKDPTRGAKVLKTYLSLPATPHDERAYDLFITSLSQFSDQAKQNNFYKSCQNFADSYAGKLAEDHPGQKLWGIDWVSADDADKKIADLKTQQTTITSATARATSLGNQVNAAQSRYDAVENAYEMRQTSHSNVREAKNQLDQLQDEEKVAQETEDDALAKVTQPPLLQSEDPLMPGDSDSFASATPSPSDSGSSVSNPVPPVVPPSSPPGQSHVPAPASPPVEPPKKVSVTNYAVAFAVAPNLAITDASAVKDGTNFTLQCPDGTVVQATLVRTDSTGKLALLQLGKKVAYLDLAATFTGGPITCTGIPEVNIFNPTPEGITGTAPAPADGWQIKLNKHPRLGGAPLTAGGKLVGAELAARDSDIAQIPAIALEAIRSFVGSDLPAPGHGTTTPSATIFQLVSTSEP
jgi:hypothetical protein